MKQYLIDVYIADDHQMVCEGLSEIINQSGKAHVSRTFNTLEACRQTLAERRPDVLLIDLSMPDGDGVAFSQQVVRDYPDVRIVAVTIHDEYSVVQRMMACGAHGYVLKSSSADELLEAIVTVWQKRQYISPLVERILQQGRESSVILTAVEQNILQLLCNGLTNPQIATQMNLSTETVNWYRKRLLAKFGVKNTVMLVKHAIEEQLV
ncbi:MAG: response regulator transcription factor [Prevotella sp.]|jgi:DNA-binding NarL/FixJ family response regulator|nr:response regulator transcription factor [Prevotella sp.]MBR0259998.1 response regulator transcription factor [Prevotella sp.]